MLNTDWYVRQIIRRPAYDYDAAKGPTIYRNQQWTKPTSSPIHMTMSDADSVPAYYPLDKPMSFSAGDIKATIDPRNLDHGLLQRADLFVLRMIQDAWPQRPIYFARTSGGYALCPIDAGYNVLHNYLTHAFVDQAVLKEGATVQVVNGSASLPDLRFSTDSYWVTNASLGFKANVASRLLINFNMRFNVGDKGLADRVAPLLGIEWSF